MKPYFSVVVLTVVASLMAQDVAQPKRLISEKDLFNFVWVGRSATVARWQPASHSPA